MREEDETSYEAARMVDRGTSSLSLKDSLLKDLTNNTWSIDTIDTLGVDRSAEIRRENESISLNNSGDTIQLIDSFGNVVDMITYQNALRERWIVFP